MSHVLDAAYHLGQAYPGGVEALAVRLGKNATTLRHEFSGAGFAKLGLQTAVDASVLSKDYRIVNAFAAECGGMFVLLPSSLGGEGMAMQRVAVLAREFGEVVATVSEATADGEVSANELARVEREWAELVAAGQALMAHMRAKHEAGRPGGAS
jgi:hypothetical protein